MYSLTFRALALRQRETEKKEITEWIYIRKIITHVVSLWRRANARNVRLYNPYCHYTDHFIFLFTFRFVSEHCLRSTLDFMFLTDDGPTLKTLDFTFYIGSTSTFLYFDLHFITAYAAHYVYTKYKNVGVLPICMKVKSQFQFQA